MEPAMSIKSLSEMTDDELFLEFQTYDDLINVQNCYGLKDLLYHTALLKEIEQRGGEVLYRTEIVYHDSEDE